MGEDDLPIPCDKCGEEFDPNRSETKGWTCPNCHTRRPNLRLHYRIMACLCALGAAGTIIMLITSLRYHGRFGWGHLLPITQAGMLLAALSVLVLHERPWRLRSLRATIWVVYGSFVLFYLVEPVLIVLLLTREAVPGLVGFLIGLGIVLMGFGVYLGWLHAVSRRISSGSKKD
jgi:hypothetical protein